MRRPLPPIAFDFTLLLNRMRLGALTGIGQVDLDYARHFALAQGRLAVGTHYSKYGRPFVVAPGRVARIVREAESLWRREQDGTDLEFDRITEWLRDERSRPSPRRRPLASTTRDEIWYALRKTVPFAGSSFEAAIPDGAVYLNIGQFEFDHERVFRWLTRRPDLKPVFFLHDLLPLDHPEFWFAGHADRFSRRVDFMFERARGLITSSEVNRARIADEFARRGRAEIPVHVAPLPPPLAPAEPAQARSDSARRPYFVVIGTIEPRKNHLLLLNVWRELAKSGSDIPKLVIVGSRGWENEQVLDMLDRCTDLRDHVLEAPWLSAKSLRRLLLGARALLMPSIAEGYGLPIVEALSAGTPVLAADIPVAHETSRECAKFRHLLDGLGWARDILKLSDPDSDYARAAKAAALSFVTPDPSDYFAGVEAFLSEL